MADLAPDVFFDGEYFNSRQVAPCISMQSSALVEEDWLFFPAGPRRYRDAFVVSKARSATI